MKWFLYRLDWNPDKQKFDKAPCTLDGRRWPVEHRSVAVDDRGHVERCLDALPASNYWLGMIPDPGEHIFMLDMDGCVMGDGQLDAMATEVVHPFLAAGAYFEGTSSGKGVHIIGRYTGDLPAHQNKIPHLHHYEFYGDSQQGFALNRDAHSGSMDVDCTAVVHALLARWFYKASDEQMGYEVAEHGPCAEWDGETDDDALIAKALSAKGSAAAAFGHSLSFAQLWHGQCEKDSSTDLALASHLAFWTGRDVDRVVRLMWRSGLVREKWREHRTYLRELTVMRACSTTRNVYKRLQIQVVKPQPPAEGGDWTAVVTKCCAEVDGAMNIGDLVERVIPSFGPMGIPPVYASKIVDVLMQRFKLMGSPQQIGRVRMMVNPPRVQPVANDVVVPDWAAPLCYVKRLDKFMQIGTGSLMSAEGLRMTYARQMPYKNNGQREDVVIWCRERWNITAVDDVMYRPDQPAYFEHGGFAYANLFVPGSMPEPAQPSDECLQCIELFKQHLWLMVGEREPVFMALLLWIAHNVQFPGRKIRWSPLIKGVQGDGKSIVLDLLLAVMDVRNVKITSPATLANSGGFTDWAMGKAINFIEEIRLVGKEKHKLFNAMKLFIGDTTIDLNKKGKASGDSIANITNHWANTNYEDALPVDDKDRRWMIVFSPYSSIEDAVKAKGLKDVSELVQQFKRLGTSMRAEPGAWRAWLLGADCSAFDPDDRAMRTEELGIMASLSEEPIEHLVREVLQDGCPGVTVDVFSSTMLRRALKIRAQLEDLDLPSSTAWHSLLTQLGYRPWPKVVKISGSSQRLWVRRNFHAEQDAIAEILKNTWPNL